jgi:ATP-dependent Clp protease ATP-binding subunit ClpC
MTSNIGTRDIKSTGGFGFGPDTQQDQYTHMKSAIEDAVKKVFNPEFLNRIDDIIVFRPLEKSHIMKIIDIQMKELQDRMRNLGVTIELTKSAKEFLAERGYDPAFGARPLRRALQKYIEDPLAEELLRHHFGAGSIVRVSHNKRTDDLRFTDIAKTGKDSEVEPEEETNEASADAS